MILAGGRFFSGARRSVGAAFRWMVDPRPAVPCSADFDRIGLPGCGSNSSVHAGRIKYVLYAKESAAPRFRYRKVMGHPVTCARYNVLRGPLSEFFPVITERRELGATHGVLDRTVAAKPTRLASS